MMLGHLGALAPEVFRARAPLRVPIETACGQVLLGSCMQKCARVRRVDDLICPKDAVSGANGSFSPISGRKCLLLLKIAQKYCTERAKVVKYEQKKAGYV